MRRIRAAVAVSAAVLVVGALGTAAGIATAGAAEPGGDVVTAQVVPGSQTDPGGAWYLIKAEADAHVSQQVQVTNNKDHTVTARIEGIDGFTSDSTGAGYGSPGSTPSRAGTWIVVGTPEITLQPGEARIIDFSVQIPADAKPGQYLAGLSFAVPLATVTTSTVGSGQAGFQVSLQGQRVIAVQIDVPGPATPKLAVLGVTAYGSNDGVNLQVGMANEGNAFAKGTGVITVADTNLDASFEIDTFVSGTEIQYRVPWTDAIVPGVHAVKVRLNYGDGQVTTWNGELAIRGALQAQIAAELKNTKVVAKSSTNPLPVALAVLLAIALLVGAFWVRRHRKHGSGPPAPRGDDSSGDRRVPALVN